MAADDGRRMVRPGITFRVFVSSTFRDFAAERNALQERVWPRLRELCMRHGARFQAIDLRWGVSEDAAQDQRAMEICLEEIRRCQQVTPRPNFIVLLGDRYGWRPAPETISQDEFDAIQAHVADADRDLLERWYALDENTIPPEYCLLSRADVAYEVWVEIEARLHDVLLAGARAAGLSDEAMVKFERSATEQEIIAGALEADPRNAFAYFRTVEGLPQGERAEDFIDLEDGTRDSEPAGLLGDLRDRLREHFPQEHQHPIETRWDGDGLSAEHLEAFCEQVHDDLARVILEEIDKLEAEDELDQKVRAHAEFGADRRRHFVGRREIIAQLLDYVEHRGGHPLIIHGRSGSGKSALMAQVLSELPGDATVVARFIGATPASTELHSLLRGLCEQIHREFGFAGVEEQWREEQRQQEHARPEPSAQSEEPPQNPYEVPGDPRKQARAFERFLGFVPEDDTLVLFLDALDQLSPEGNAHSLYWLPRELPANVRIVASVLDREDEAGRCHQAARGRLREHPEALMALPEVTFDESEAILDAWLSEAERTLQAEQRADVLGKLRACPEGHALFLQLAFQQARRWRSFEGVPTGADDVPGLSDTVPGVIADMTARLEVPANHGPVVVARALGYLRAARHGLAEDEMLQVLSADEQVMADFRARSPFSPEVDRLPPVIWSRLYFDLRPYLIERAADGTSLLNFYHRQVGEVVEARYLEDECTRLRAHRELGEYFAGQDPWDDARARRSNLRRAAELAWQLNRAQDWSGLEVTLTDLQSLEAKAEGGMVLDMASDLAAGHRALPPDRPWARNLRLLEQALRNDLEFISRHPTTLFQCLWNSAWWYDCPDAANHYDPPEDGWGPSCAPWQRPEPKLCTLLERWRREKQTRQPGFTWVRSLRPPGLCLGGVQAAGYFGHECNVRAVAFVPGGGRVVSGDECGTLRVWDAQNGETLACLRGHDGAVTAVAVAADGGLLISGGQDRTVRVWDALSGEALMCLRGHQGPVTSVAVGPDGREIVSGSEDCAVRVWGADSGEELSCLVGHAGAVRSVAVSPDGCWIASGSDDYTIQIWDAKTGERLTCLLGHDDALRSVAISPDGSALASGSLDTTVRLWDPHEGAELACLRGHERSISCVAFHPDGATLLSCSPDETVRSWDRRSGKGTELARAFPPMAIACSPDGTRVAVAAVQGVALLALKADYGGRLRGPGVPVKEVVALSEDARSVAVGRQWLDPLLSVWSVTNGGLLASLPHKWDSAPGFSEVTCIAFSPTGDQIACGLRDGAVWLWFTAGGALASCLRGHGASILSLAFTPNGLTIASASADSTLRVWYTSGQEVAVLHGHDGAAVSVGISPDGCRLVSGSRDGTVRLWDVATAQQVACFGDDPAPLPDRFSAEDRAALAHGGFGRWVVDGVAFSADGTRFASWHSIQTFEDSKPGLVQRREVRIWDAFSFERLRVIGVDYGAKAFAWSGADHAAQIADRGIDMAFEECGTGRVLAWYSPSLDGLRMARFGRTWAGISRYSHSAVVLALEGDPAADGRGER